MHERPRLRGTTTRTSRPVVARPHRALLHLCVQTARVLTPSPRPPLLHGFRRARAASTPAYRTTWQERRPRGRGVRARHRGSAHCCHRYLDSALCRPAFAHCAHPARGALGAAKGWGEHRLQALASKQTRTRGFGGPSPPQTHSAREPSGNPRRAHATATVAPAETHLAVRHPPPAKAGVDGVQEKLLWTTNASAAPSVVSFGLSLNPHKRNEQ